MKEDQLHELANLFMSQFVYEPCSLDDFLYDYKATLTEDELNLGNYILKLFN
jgi:hypothetical protein